MHDEVGVDRLEHQPLRRRHLAQPRQLRRAMQTPTFVCGSIPRSSARSQAQATYDDEVVVPVLGAAARATSGFTSGFSPVSTSSSFTPRRGGVVEHPLDLVRRVEVRPVCRERAVLAVALARPRQRQREVPRKGDPAHLAGV